MPVLPPKRMLRAIGSRNVRTRQYPPWPHLHEMDHQGSIPRFRLFGMEETIERIVGFFRHAAQGLEERSRSSTARAGSVVGNLARQKGEAVMRMSRLSAEGGE